MVPRQGTLSPAVVLPEELLSLIFSFLGVADLNSAAQVCKRWRDSINASHLWRSREVSLEFPALQRRATRTCLIQRGIPNLTVRRTSSIFILGFCVSRLHRILRVLRLSQSTAGCDVRGHLFQRAMPCVESVDLGNTAVGNNVVWSIAAYASRLTVLSIGKAQNLTDEGLGIIGSLIMPTLKSLRMQGSKSITDNGVCFLGGCNAETEGWPPYTNSLEELHLLAFKGLTGRSLQIISSTFGNLRNLNLACCRNIVSGEGLSLSGLTNLKELGIGHCEVTDESFLELTEGLKGVEVLDLRDNDIGDYTLQSLPHVFPNLTRLNICFSTLVSTEGVMAVARSLPRLQELYLVEGPAVSESELRAVTEQIRKDKPNVIIHLRNENIISFTC